MPGALRTAGGGRHTAPAGVGFADSAPHGLDQHRETPHSDAPDRHHEGNAHARAHARGRSGPIAGRDGPAQAAAPLATSLRSAPRQADRRWAGPGAGRRARGRRRLRQRWCWARRVLRQRRRSGARERAQRLPRSADQCAGLSAAGGSPRVALGPPPRCRRRENSAASALAASGAAAWCTGGRCGSCWSWFWRCHCSGGPGGWRLF
mmetsp:Transcript_73942/g.192533  ORF Transcript_73942/g.192533 Transcript_73942/m.192533 type:complete len:206 (+) Transcript_73942:236-853(+)